MIGARGRRPTCGAAADDELALGFFCHSDLRRTETRGLRKAREARSHLRYPHQVGVVTGDAKTAGAGSRPGNFAALLLHVDPTKKDDDRRLRHERFLKATFTPFIMNSSSNHLKSINAPTQRHTPVPLSHLWRAGIGRHLCLHLHSLLTGVKAPLLTE